MILDAGVPVALGSDDPLLFGAGLADQYMIARDVLKLSDAELAALARHSVTASAAPPDLQRTLLSGIDDWLGQ
jgi:adenosine deaminase